MKSRFYLPLHANHLLVAAWVVVLAYLLLAAIGAFIYDCSEDIGDSCEYIYVAKGILEGDIPYFDRWDHKGPLLYLLNLIGLVIHESWGLWVVQGAFLLGASSFAFLTLRRGFGTTPALFSLALFLVSYSRLAPQGNDTELYLLLFQFLALFLFLHSQEQPNPAASRARPRHRRPRRCFLPSETQPHRPLDRHRPLLATAARRLPAQTCLGRCRRWECACLCGGSVYCLRGMERALGCSLRIQLRT